MAPFRTFDDIVRNGFIRLGVNVDIPPTALHDADGKLAGFDVDFGSALAAFAGLEPRFVLVEANERIPFLRNGKVDAVLAGFARSPARAALVDFTIPIMTERFGLMTRTELGFGNWQELNRDDVVLSIASGTTAIAYAGQLLPRARIAETVDHREQVARVGERTAHASLNVIPMNMAHTRHYPDIGWQILDTPSPPAYDCIGVPKGNGALRRWLNTAIFELQNSGRAETMWKRWFGDEIEYGLTSPSPYF